jgi:hypothetical protein
MQKSSALNFHRFLPLRKATALRDHAKGKGEAQAEMMKPTGPSGKAVLISTHARERRLIGFAEQWIRHHIIKRQILRAYGSRRSMVRVFRSFTARPVARIITSTTCPSEKRRGQFKFAAPESNRSGSPRRQQLGIGFPDLTSALQQVGSYLRYAGRDVDVGANAPVTNT